MKQSSWRPFFVVSLALCIGTVGTALSSPLYPIYQHVWQLLPSDITYIFVAYMFGCLTTLLFLGRISNNLGFIRTLQIGLLFAILGLTASVFAQNAYILGFGRFIIGIASGLISTSAMLGLIYTIPDSHKANAPQLSSIITVFGFGLGPVLGGVIAQFSKYPLITPYLPIIAAACFSLVSLLSIKAPSFEKQKFTMAPHLELPKTSNKTLFYVASFAAFSAFSTFSLFASLAPSFIQEIIPWHGPLVSGATITGILLASLLVQISAKTLNMHRCLKLGFISLMTSSVILMLCLIMHWSAIFFISVIFAGMGHGLCLMGAFSLIHKMTILENRAAVIATYLFIAYWGSIIPIVAVGYLSDLWGLNIGVISFCITQSLLCCFLLRLHQQATTKVKLQHTAS